MTRIQKLEKLRKKTVKELANCYVKVFELEIKIKEIDGELWKAEQYGELWNSDQEELNLGGKNNV